MNAIIVELIDGKFDFEWYFKCELIKMNLVIREASFVSYLYALALHAINEKAQTFRI